MFVWRTSSHVTCHTRGGGRSTPPVSALTYPYAWPSACTRSLRWCTRDRGGLAEPTNCQAARKCTAAAGAVVHRSRGPAAPSPICAAKSPERARSLGPYLRSAKAKARREILSGSLSELRHQKLNQSRQSQANYNLEISSEQSIHTYI